MDLVVPEYIQENPVAFVFMLTLSLVGFSIRLVGALINFYEEVLIKRYFNRLNSLSEHLPESSRTNEYISKLKENEVFRLASGIKSSPEKSNVLVEIYLSGVVDNRELKRIQRFIEPSGDKVEIQTDFFDRFQILYSFVAALYLLVTGMIFGGQYFIFGNSSEALAGIAIMVLMTITAAVVGVDFRTYRTLKRIRKRLIDLDVVANPHAQLMWSLWRVNPNTYEPPACQ